MNPWSEDLIPLDSARTLDGLFVQRVRRSPERVAYRRFQRGEQSWTALTWMDMERQVGRWQQALSEQGLQPGDRVAVALRNGPEWVMFDQASLGLGLVTVPLYTDDRAENAAYILQDAAARLLLIQDAGRWRRLAPVIGGHRHPERVVLLDSGAEAQRLARQDPRVVTAHQWLPEQGREVRQRAADPHALATIVYTSGTTGRPKGVMLTHHNILSNTHGALTVLACYPEDVFLSFLPLSHMFERTAGYYVPMMAGAQVAYARSVVQLAEDMLTIRPTVLIAVPRVFERVYQRLHAQMQQRPAAVRWLFRQTVKVGWRQFQYVQGRTDWHPSLLAWPFLERKVAAQVLARLGGRIRAAVSGGAPLSREVAHTFVGLGLPLVQGYGLTETSPVVSVNPLHDNNPDSVGVSLRGIRIRIGADDELLVKGPGNMLGYWNNHAATAGVIDPEGWLHTGDQARRDDGHLYITGRIKDILVLSNGEKVPPADMEMALDLDPLFEQTLVIGEGKSYLSALVVLNDDLWPGLAREYDLDPSNQRGLADPRLVKEMLQRVQSALKDFPGYAKIRRLTLLLEPWTVDNGLMTPTLKVKRAEVVKRYAQQVADMYR